MCHMYFDSHISQVSPVSLLYTWEVWDSSTHQDDHSILGLVVLGVLIHVLQYLVLDNDIEMGQWLAKATVFTYY